MTGKLSELSALTALDDNDIIEVLDVSDTTMAASGTNKTTTARGIATAAGAVRAYSFTIPHDASGLSDGTGYVFTTVEASGLIKPGDHIVDVIVHVTAAFDGTSGQQLDFASSAGDSGYDGGFLYAESGLQFFPKETGESVVTTAGFLKADGGFQDSNSRYSFAAAYFGSTSAHQFVAGDLVAFLTKDGFNRGTYSGGGSNDPGNSVGELVLTLYVASSVVI